MLQKQSLNKVKFDDSMPLKSQHLSAKFARVASLYFLNHVPVMVTDLNFICSD